MFLPRLNVVVRQVAATALAGVLSVGSWAQDTQATPAPAQPAPTVPQAPQPQQFVLKNYAKPQSHFPNPIAPYTSHHVAPPILTNTTRIEQLLRDGKIYLSMDDAVALALENNLDIAIARYNLNIADTDILRAKAGGSTLGINSGIVANTPGGAQSSIGSQVGSGTGGTNPGSGGAGAGFGGLVGSTLGNGPAITSYDPILTGTSQSDHSDS
jgi:outer membrane protein